MPRLSISVFSRRSWFVVAVFATAAFLVLSGLHVLYPSVGAQAAPEAEKPAMVTERADEAAAMLAARSQGKRVAITGTRTDSTVTYANPDGSLTLESFSGTQYVQKQNGSWDDLDLTLAVREGVVSPALTPVKIEISNGGKPGGSLASVIADAESGASPAGSSLTFKWPTALPKPELSGDTATYSNVMPDIDVKVRALAHGYETYIVLKRRPTATPVFELPVETKGLEL